LRTLNTRVYPLATPLLQGACFSVTAPAPRIPIRRPRHRNELPTVPRRRQRELQHTVGVGVVRLRVRDRCAERVVTGAPCPDHELADPPRRVRRARRGLRRQALIIVIVPRDYQ